MVSKLCFYCLLLSLLWGLEPYYAPPDSDAMHEDYLCTLESECKAKASGGSGGEKGELVKATPVSSKPDVVAVAIGSAF